MICLAGLGEDAVLSNHIFVAGHCFADDQVLAGLKKQVNKTTFQFKTQGKFLGNVPWRCSLKLELQFWNFCCFPGKSKFLKGKDQRIEKGICNVFSYKMNMPIHTD